MQLLTSLLAEILGKSLKLYHKWGLFAKPGPSCYSGKIALTGRSDCGRRGEAEKKPGKAFRLPRSQELVYFTNLM